MRNLASIQMISALSPIEGKDRIELALVQGWSVIVQKGEYKVGDYTIFVEPDSVLPERPEFEFLRSKKFRIKTMKMAGVISQGICFPLSILPNDQKVIVEGRDVTEDLGITKYDPYAYEEPKEQKKSNPLRDFLLRYKATRWLGRLIFGATKREQQGFPDFIAKTDETRIQNMPFVLVNKDIKWVAREKIDGQSGTFFLKRTKKGFEFGVCSRNLRLKEPNNSSQWAVAIKYDIENVLKKLIGDADWIAIQGECIAPNVQGNKYRVTEPDLYVFNLIRPDGFISCEIGEQIMREHGIKWCPLITNCYVMPDTVQEVLADATGKSQLYDTLREGIVFRHYMSIQDYRGGKVVKQSCKAVSPEFLLKHQE